MNMLSSVASVGSLGESVRKGTTQGKITQKGK